MEETFEVGLGVRRAWNVLGVKPYVGAGGSWVRGSFAIEVIDDRTVDLGFTDTIINVPELLAEYRPTNDLTFEDGDPPANALGCSGHWFDIQDGDNLLAASWYEHGVKVIELQEDYSMQQIGFFQPVAAESGAAYWVVDDDGTEYIYSTDYARGVDVLRFDRDAAHPTAEEIEQAWLARGAHVGTFAEAERLVCRLGDDGALLP